MKVGWFTIILVLTIFTTGAFRPLMVKTAAVADPLLILLVWFALVDRWPRIVVVLSVICIYRLYGGISTPLEVLAPLLVVLIAVRGLRQLLDPYHPWKRFQIVIPALLLGAVLQEFVLAGNLPTISFVFQSCWVVALFVALLFPVLDLTTPLLRSARFPL